MIEVFRGINVVHSFEPDDNSNHQKILLQSDKINVSVTFEEYKEFKIGDYINIPDKNVLNSTTGDTKYYLFRLPEIRRESYYSYKYSLVFSGRMHRLENIAFLHEGTPSFFFTGNASKFMLLLKQNLQRVLGGAVNALSTGFVAEGGSLNVKTLDFNNLNCLDALRTIAEAWNTEFQFYLVDNASVRLLDTEGDQSLTTSYWFKTQGIRKIVSKPLNSDGLITRLYVLGSERNISFSDYGSKRLQMPGSPYIENNVSEYGIIEGVHIFDDIYPHRTGSVTGVTTVGGAAITYKITDSSIDFDINDYLTGSTAKITFTSGNLAGYEFEIIGYDHALKEIHFNAFTDDQDFTVPNATFKMQGGDTYVLHEIKMPQSYITAAENELVTKANSMLTDLSAIRYEYDVEMDYVHLREFDRAFNIGDRFRLNPIDFGGTLTEFRIVSMVKNINNPYDYKLTIAEKYRHGRVSRIDKKVRIAEGLVRKESRERKIAGYRTD